MRNTFTFSSLRSGRAGNEKTASMQSATIAVQLVPVLEHRPFATGVPLNRVIPVSVAALRAQLQARRMRTIAFVFCASLLAFLGLGVLVGYFVRPIPSPPPLPPMPPTTPPSPPAPPHLPPDPPEPPPAPKPSPPSPPGSPPLYLSLDVGVWTLGPLGASCDETCALTNATCNASALPTIHNEDLVQAAAHSAGEACAQMRGWGYAWSPGRCDHADCCIDTDDFPCINLCSYLDEDQPFCNASDSHYTRFCPCV